MAEVLQKLTNFKQAAQPAATLEDIDELHERVDDALSRILGLDSVAAELRDVKADKSSLAKLSQAIRDLWRAVQELQGPEGARCCGCVCGRSSPRLLAPPIRRQQVCHASCGGACYRLCPCL